MTTCWLELRQVVQRLAGEERMMTWWGQRLLGDFQSQRTFTGTGDRSTLVCAGLGRARGVTVKMTSLQLIRVARLVGRGS